MISDKVFAVCCKKCGALYGCEIQFMSQQMKDLLLLSEEQGSTVSTVLKETLPCPVCRLTTKIAEALERSVSAEVV